MYQGIKEAIDHLYQNIKDDYVASQIVDEFIDDFNTILNDPNNGLSEEEITRFKGLIHDPEYQDQLTKQLAIWSKEVKENGLSQEEFANAVTHFTHSQPNIELQDCIKAFTLVYKKGNVYVEFKGDTKANFSINCITSMNHYSDNPDFQHTLSQIEMKGATGDVTYSNGTNRYVYIEDFQIEKDCDYITQHFDEYRRFIVRTINSHTACNENQDSDEANNTLGLGNYEYTVLKENLERLESYARKNQEYEFYTDGRSFRLNQSGEVEEVENALTNEQITHGKWDDTSIDTKYRLSTNVQGELEFKAIGIRANLPLFDTGKKANLHALSVNMKDKANRFLAKYHTKKVQETPKQKGATLASDAFADGKRIAIKEEVSFFKIINEGAGKMTELLKTGEIEESTYLESTEPTEIVHAPGVVTGSTEAATRAVTDITGVVVLVYDLTVDEQARQQTWEGLKKVKDQIAEEPSTLFPILTDIIVEEATGNTPANWAEITGEGTDFGKKSHLTSKGAVRTTMTVFASGKLILKLPKMADDLAFRMVRSKLLKHLDNLGWEEAIKEIFKADLDDVANGGIRELFEGTDDVRHIDLAKAWKAIYDNGITDAIRKNPDALNHIADAINEGLDAIDAIEDALQTLNKTRWEEIKALFKRGNDFNRKAKNDNWYDFNEIHLENGKRLDSYDPDLGEIVSRKATDFDNIQTSTFENYLKEIDSKYSVGTKIRSNKYPELDGQLLQGDKILEVPASNQTSSKLSDFIELANQYNTIIRFRNE